MLGEFKAGRSPILIATDVASRGLGTLFLFSSQALRRGASPMHRVVKTIDATSSFNRKILGCVNPESDRTDNPTRGTSRGNLTR